jgi:HAD superfamily hydrolase (TIGR01509 family)
VGERSEINDYAASVGQSVDAAAIHKSKSQIFQEYLSAGEVKPRSGVVETIAQAKRQGIKLGLVTTTSEENVSLLLSALASAIDRADFDLVVDASMVERSKPAGDAYVFALTELNEKTENCVAIEDNLGGLTAAQAAGISCVAFPGENTTDHDFLRADLRVDQLSFDGLKRFV